MTREEIILILEKTYTGSEHIGDVYNSEVADQLLQLHIEGVREEKKKGYDDGVYACRSGLEKCPRHLTSLRCLDCIEELRISLKGEKLEGLQPKE